MIANRVHFDLQWSIYEKAKWCKDVYDYYTCALSHMSNCSSEPVLTDMAQLTLFMNFIEKSANRECPGGLYGCLINDDSDIRCRLGAKYFLDRNSLINRAWQRSISHVIVLTLASSITVRFY
jgi:hypothetical protein